MSIVPTELYLAKRQCPDAGDSGSLNTSLTSLSWLQKMRDSGVKLALVEVGQWAFEAEQDRTPIDWKTNTEIKPPFSYVTLIYMAMKDSHKSKVTLNDIYTYIMDNFLWYRCCEPGWKVSKCSLA